MAGSPNAFASLPPAQARPPSVLSERDHNVRSHKRPRLSEDAVAAIHTQSADANTSLEVDHMILDYLAYQSMRACFSSRNPNDHDAAYISLAGNNEMVNAFLTLFKTTYPVYEPDAELSFRISLLKLTTLFTQRLTSNPTTPPPSALRKLRKANKDRTSEWINSAGHKPSSRLNLPAADTTRSVPQQQLERNRAHVLHELGIPAEDEHYEEPFYGTRSCVSLLDLLPLFLQISAARNAMSGSNLTSRWMQLACEFMLQACLEQHLVFGANDVREVVDEAFAWGYRDNAEKLEQEEAASISNAEINAMFEDEDYATEVEGWEEMKISHIQELAPLVHNDQSADFQAVTAKHSIATFEQDVLEFLQAISKSISEPILYQLEKGKLDGMTERETKDFLADCGVGVARFFDGLAGFKISLD